MTPSPAAGEDRPDGSDGALEGLRSGQVKSGPVDGGRSGRQAAAALCCVNLNWARQNSGRKFRQADGQLAAGSLEARKVRFCGERTQ